MVLEQFLDEDKTNNTQQEQSHAGSPILDSFLEGSKTPKATQPKMLPNNTVQQQQPKININKVNNDGVLNTTIADVPQVDTQGLNPLQKVNYSVQHALAPTNKEQVRLNNQVRMYQGDNPYLQPIQDSDALNAYQLEAKKNRWLGARHWIANEAKHLGKSVLNSIRHPIHTGKKALAGLGLGITDLPRQALSLSDGALYAMSHPQNKVAIDYLNETYREPVFDYMVSHPNGSLGDALRHNNIDEDFIKSINADNTRYTHTGQLDKELFNKYYDFIKKNKPDLYKNVQKYTKQKYLQDKHAHVNANALAREEYANDLLKDVLGLSDSDLHSNTTSLGRLGGNIVGFGEGIGAAGKVVQGVKQAPNMIGKAALGAEELAANAQQAIQNNKAIMNTVNAVQKPISAIANTEIPLANKLPFVKPTIGDAAKVLNKNGVITAEFAAANHGLNNLSGLGNQYGLANDVAHGYVEGLPFAGVHFAGKAVGAGGKFVKNKFDETELGKQWKKQQELSELVAIANKNGLEFLTNEDMSWFDKFSKQPEEVKRKIVKVLDSGIITDEPSMEVAIDKLSKEYTDAQSSEKPQEPTIDIKQETDNNTPDDTKSLQNEPSSDVVVDGQQETKKGGKTNADMISNFEKNTGEKISDITADENVDIKNPFKKRQKIATTVKEGASVSQGRFTQGIKKQTTKNDRQNIDAANKTVVTLDGGMAEGADTLQRIVADDGIDRNKNNQDTKVDYGKFNKILENKGEIYEFTQDGRLVYRMGEKQGLEVSKHDRVKLMQRLGGEVGQYRDFANKKVDINSSKQVRGDNGRTYLVDNNGQYHELFEDVDTGVWSVNSEFKNYKFKEMDNGEIFAIKGNNWYKVKTNNDGMVTQIATKPIDRYKGINKEEYAIDDSDINNLEGKTEEGEIDTDITTENRHEKESEYETNTRDDISQGEKDAINRSSKYENGMSEENSEKETSYTKYKNPEIGKQIEDVIIGRKTTSEIADEIIRSSNGDNRKIVKYINDLKLESDNEIDKLGKRIELTEDVRTDTQITKIVDKVIDKINDKVDISDVLPSDYEITQKERDVADKFWRKISNTRWTRTKGTNPYIRLKNAFDKTRSWNKDEVQKTYDNLHNKIDTISKEKGFTDRVREIMFADLEEAANKLESETHAKIERKTHQTRFQKENELFNTVKYLLDNNNVKKAVSLLHDKNVDYQYIKSSENKKIYRDVYYKLNQETNDLVNINNPKDINRILGEYNLALKSEKSGGNGLNNFKEYYGQTITDIIAKADELNKSQKPYIDYVQRQIHKTVRSRENAIKTSNTIFDEPTHFIDNYENSRVSGAITDRSLLNKAKEAYDHNIDIEVENKKGQLKTDDLIKHGTKEDFDLINSYRDEHNNLDIERLYNDVKRFEDEKGLRKEYLKQNKLLKQKGMKTLRDWKGFLARNKHKAEVLRNEYGKNLNAWERNGILKNPESHSFDIDGNYIPPTIEEARQKAKKENHNIVMDVIKGKGRYEYLGKRTTLGDVLNDLMDKYDTTCVNRLIKFAKNTKVTIGSLLKGKRGQFNKTDGITLDYMRGYGDAVFHEGNHAYLKSRSANDEIVKSIVENNENANVPFIQLTNVNNRGMFSKYLDCIDDGQEISNLINNTDNGGTYKFIHEKMLKYVTDCAEIFCDTHGILHNMDIIEFNEIFSQIEPNISKKIKDGYYETPKQARTEILEELEQRIPEQFKLGERHSNGETLGRPSGKIPSNDRGRQTELGTSFSIDINNVLEEDNSPSSKQAKRKLEEDPIGFIDTLNDAQRKVLVEATGGEEAAQIYSDIVKNVETYERDMRYIGAMSDKRQLQDVINRYASNVTGKPVHALTASEKRGAEKIVKAHILAEGAKSNIHYNIFNHQNNETIDLNSDVSGKSEALFGTKSGFASGEYKDPDKIVLSVLAKHRQGEAVRHLSDFIMDNYGEEINSKQGVKRGYTAINREVLNLTILKKASEHFYDAITGGKESIEKTFGKDSQLTKELQDVLDASSEANYQIPTRIYKQIFNGSGESGKQLKERYGKKAFWDIQGKRLDEYMKPFNRIVLGLSPRWMVGNAVSNAVMMSQLFDTPLQFVKAHIDAFKILDSDMPTGVIDNTLLGASRQKSTRLFVTGNETVDSCTSALLGMAKIDTKNLESLNDKTIAKTSNACGIPARVLINLSGKMMEFNMKLENHQRKAVYMRLVDTVGKDLIAQTGQNIVRQSELLKYINKNPKIKDQLGKAVLDTLGDYQKMTNAERNIVKRIAPYHKWIRAVVRYGSNLLVKNPDFAAQIFWEGQKLAMMNAQLQENQEYAISIGKDNDTQKDLVLNLSRYLNPFDTLRDITAVQTALSMVHPAIKSIIEVPFSNKVTFHNAEKTSANWKRVKDKSGKFTYINTKDGSKRSSLPPSEKLKAFGTEQLNNVYAPMNNRLLNVPEIIDSINNYSSINPSNKYAGKFRPKDKRYSVGYGTYNNNDLVPNVQNKYGNPEHRKAEQYSTSGYLSRKVLPIENKQPVKEYFLNDKEKEKFRKKVAKQKQKYKKSK